MCAAPNTSDPISQAPPPPYSPASASTPTPATAPVEKRQSQPAKRSRFKTAVPLILLRQYAAPVDCPVCGQRNMTKLKYVTSVYTHMMTLALISTVFFVWVPYAVNAFKNVEHHCGNPDCDALVATFHRASPGNIEVHMFD